MAPTLATNRRVAYISATLIHTFYATMNELQNMTSKVLASDVRDHVQIFTLSYSTHKRETESSLIQSET